MSCSPEYSSTALKGIPIQMLTKVTTNIRLERRVEPEDRGMDQVERTEHLVDDAALAGEHYGKDRRARDRREQPGYDYQAPEELGQEEAPVEVRSDGEADAELEDDGQHQENSGVHEGCACDWVVYLDLVVVEPDERPAPGDETQVFDAHREAVDERVGEEDDHIRECGQDESEQDRVPAVRAQPMQRRGGPGGPGSGDGDDRCRGTKPRPS